MRITTIRTTAIRTDEMQPASLLGLMRLASPALPVGAFSYSEGLEAAAEAGCVVDEATARDWLLDQLLVCLARADLPVVAAAWNAWHDDDRAAIAPLNEWFTTTRETAEQRLQTEQTGRSLTDWLRQRDAKDARIAALAALRPAPTWPIAFALAAWRTGAPLRDALLAFGFGWAENLVQATIRAVPLGQSAGQRIVGALVDALPSAVDAALRGGIDERQAFAPGLAILSARHETQYSRLFRS